MATCSTAGCKVKPRQNEIQCIKCKRQSDTTSDDVVNYDNIIINEVLWYADQHRHAASKDAILKVLACHCSLEDVNIAKALMISKFGEYVNPERKKNRKDSHNRTEKMKVCEDIVDGLFDIDEHIDITCVPLRWKKVIKVAPEEVPDLMLAEKLVEMDSKFKLFEDALSELKAKQLVLEEQQEQQSHQRPLMSKVVSGEAKPSQSVPQMSMPSTSSVADIQPSGGHSQSQINRAGRPRINQPTDQGVNIDDNDGFTLPADQRRRNIKQSRNNQRNQQQTYTASNQQPRERRQPTVGRGEDTNGLRATPMPSRDIFIYRVHKDDGVDVMVDYIRKKGVSVRDITKMSHDAAKFNSFRIVVSSNDADKVLHAQFWPKGIYIRRWRDNTNKQRHSEDQSTEAHDNVDTVIDGASTNEN